MKKINYFHKKPNNNSRHNSQENIHHFICRVRYSNKYRHFILFMRTLRLDECFLENKSYKNWRYVSPVLFIEISQINKFYVISIDWILPSNKASKVVTTKSYTYCVWKKKCFIRMMDSIYLLINNIVISKYQW